MSSIKDVNSEYYWCVNGVFTYKRHDNMDEQFFNKYAYKIVFINLFSLFQIFNHAIFRWYVRFTQGICPFCFFLVIYNIWKYNIFQVLTNISSFFSLYNIPWGSIRAGSYSITMADTLTEKVISNVA